jgi:alpha-beta hydrolase superfamily lysophospholipase
MVFSLLLIHQKSNIILTAFNRLSKFENENTDVILLGHSMGGLLAADVALLKDYTGKKRHRILGIIAFDTPFLGMHPGVISAGLGSIFRPAPKSPGEDAQGLYANSAEGSSQSNMSLHTMNSGGSQVDEFYSKPPARNYTVVLPKIGQLNPF